MKNSTKHATKFKSVLKKLKGADPVLPEPQDPVTMLAYAFCAWESTSHKALKSCRQLRDSIVDWNDLRVCKPDEIADMAGFTDTRRIERARRLRTSMHTIYLREHRTSLDSVQDLKKREAREYIESLDGIVPYVSSFVLLHCFDIHAVPVDEQVRQLLVEGGAIDESADVAEVCGWVSRQVGSADGISAAARLQSWVDGESRRLTKEAAAAHKADAQARKRLLAKMEAEHKKAIEAAAEVARVKAAAKKKAAARKAAPKAVVAKSPVIRKPAAKKAATRKKVTKKAATKKKVTKKKASKKAVTRKKTTSKSATKKAATRKKRGR